MCINQKEKTNSCQKKKTKQKRENIEKAKKGTRHVDRAGQFGRLCKAALVASRTRFLLDLSPDCR